MQAICKRLGLEKKFYASVHGIDLQLPTASTNATVELSAEDKDLIARARVKKMEEIRLRHGK